MDGMSLSQAIPSDAARASLGATDPMGGDRDLLTKLLRDFDGAEEASYDARLQSEECRDFRQGKQWTAAQAAVLRARNQPLTWNNVIGRKIDLLCGMERRGRSDPKAYPRTPDQENRSDVATQVLRYVSDDQRYDVVRSSVYENMLVEGYGGAEVIVEPDDADKAALMGSTSMTPQQPSYRIQINHIPWERLFHDPHSQHKGFSDARFLGMVIWLDWDEALERYPGCQDVLETSSASNGALSGTYEDKPRWFTAWTDSGRTRVRVVQMHYKRGRDWWVATFTKGGFLEEPMKSPYMDRHGNAACPLIMRSARVDRNNNRFGIVPDMVPLQKSINSRESKLMHSLNVTQLLLENGAVDDVDKARREAAKPDGVIVRNKGFEFEVRKDSAEIEGQFKLLEYTIAQMNVAGPNAAMSGKDPREQSGRAIIAQQSGGQMENEPLADELRQFTHKIFEAVWMRVRQFWTSQKMIRVTDSDRNVQFLGLNHPVTLADELQKMDPAQAQQVIARMGLQGPQDLRLQQVVRVENQIDDLDVDITIEEGPDTPSLQIEQFQQLMQLPPQILMQFPPEVIIKASSLRNKDDLLKDMQEFQKQKEASQQGQQAAQAAMQQAQVAKAQADAADRIAQAKDRGAQTLERLHSMANDHAAAQHVPNLPGVGTVQPEQNPLVLAAQQSAQQAIQPPAPAGPQPQ